MGVPKFYRWLSERYPLINQAIEDAIRPEFDSMYLDMNGIIHTATHGPGVDPAQPLADDAAMSNVFKYIDKVVRLGRPKRLLYMCLDGVAPRAKMNQQRQRRFRSAEESKKVREEAISKGELKPDIVLFDSNCITPGTTFMAKLTKHLKFFIRKKIEEDPLWRKFEVLFSGHEVPGEAEHKIMNYIRCMKSSQGYDPNTRHLLYGLDADLVFLSLATHEPHFALLREEIVFGKPRKPNSTREPVSDSSADHFQLLHISILRDCIGHEFRSVNIPFGFDLERIIDDWIFLSFLIGNDFIPHLPSMEIHHGCLDRLIAVYKSLLPCYSGYLTDSGTIDIERLEVMFHRLAEFEQEVLEMQKKDMEKIQRGFHYHPRKNNNIERLPVGHEVEAATKADPNGVKQVDVDSSDDSDPDDLQTAVRNLEIEEDDLVDTYYQEKWFGLMDDPDELRKLCRSYLEGLQWVLLYYYQGTPSWDWFFPYFYAPLSSSMRNLKEYQIAFSVGNPFLPYEQLLGVLPASSAPLIPEPLAKLMTDPLSPILEFYPTTFQIDMNGKRNDWEGIALIPFVDEQLLIQAIRSLPPAAFTKEERRRNSHGPEQTYRYDPTIMKEAKSSMPNMFSSLAVSHCRVEDAPIFTIPGDGIYRSHLCTGIKFPAPSFPCLNSIDISMTLAPLGVNVFGHPSKRESLVATILPDASQSPLEAMRNLIQKQCIVDWPFLRDAKVVSVTNGIMRYSADAPQGQQLSAKEVLDLEEAVADEQLKLLSSRATDIGSGRIRVEVRLFTGMERTSSGAIHKKFTSATAWYPAQLVLHSRTVADSRFEIAPVQSIKEAFPIKCPIILVESSSPYYGCPGVVIQHDSKFSATVVLNVFDNDSDVGSVCRYIQSQERWLPSFRVVQELGMSPSLLGRISSTQLVNPGRVNVGLSLKLVQRKLVVPGYTRGTFGRGTDSSINWEYSYAAIVLINSYWNAFPELFDLIDECNDRVVDLTNRIPNPKGYLSQVESWLKALPCSRLPLVPLTSRVLSTDAISEIDEALIQLKPYRGNCTEVRIADVPIKALYKHAQHVQWSPSQSQPPFLGDRVLFLGGYHGVPFGLKGVLVGIHQDDFEVVFDEPILSGGDLNGRCRPCRGLSLPAKCLLNLSREGAISKPTQVARQSFSRTKIRTWVPAMPHPMVRQSEPTNIISHVAPTGIIKQPTRILAQTSTTTIIKQGTGATINIRQPSPPASIRRPQTITTVREPTSTRIVRQSPPTTSIRNKKASMTSISQLDPPPAATVRHPILATRARYQAVTAPTGQAQATRRPAPTTEPAIPARTLSKQQGSQWIPNVSQSIPTAMPEPVDDDRDYAKFWSQIQPEVVSTGVNRWKEPLQSSYPQNGYRPNVQQKPISMTLPQPMRVDKPASRYVPMTRRQAWPFRRGSGQ